MHHFKYSARDALKTARKDKSKRRKKTKKVLKSKRKR